MYSRMRSTLFMFSSTSVVWRSIQVRRSVRSRVAVSSSPARPAHAPQSTYKVAQSVTDQRFNRAIALTAKAGAQGMQSSSPSF